MAKNKHRQTDLEPIGHTNTYTFLCISTYTKVNTCTHTYIYMEKHLPSQRE